MMTKAVQVYQDVTALNTESRKLLYREILDEDIFTERGKHFARALKKLVFKGEIESYEQWFKDDESLSGLRESELTRVLPVYICLASPEVSEDLFIQILGRYERNTQSSIADSIAFYLDGNEGLSGEYFIRVQHVMLALSRLAPVDSSICGLGEDNLIRMFNRYLSRVSYNGNGNYCLWPLFFEQFDSGFAELHSQFGERDELIIKLLQELFGSEPHHSGAYVDVSFVGFCRRYFSRNLSSEFLSYLDRVYFSIAEDQRITFDGSKILPVDM